MRRSEGRSRPGCGVLTLLLAAVGLWGCQSPGEYRREADRVAYDIIEQKQREGLGKVERFSIESPADTLRRRLLEAQGLAVSGEASLGRTALEPTEHWPDDDYLTRAVPSADPALESAGAAALELTLDEALQVAANNSRAYQSQKEDVYRAALDLELERDVFRATFVGLTDGRIVTDTTTGDTVTGVDSSSELGVSQRFKNGVELISAITFDVAKLLSADTPGSSALAFDASIQVPLLRGSGRHIVAEPLTQAERDALYAIWRFERFKRTFAVDVASAYLGVLQQFDQVQNAEEDYRRRVLSVRRTRALAQEGRIAETEVDQARSDELSARNSWISAQQRYEQQLDQFKNTLGLPTDAAVVLDRGELGRLAEVVRGYFGQMEELGQPGAGGAELDREVPPVDAPVALDPPTREGGGPYELGERRAIELALEHRLDLMTQLGQVYDAQRSVVVAADALGAELTLLGSVATGEGRSIGSADAPGNTDLRFDRARYEALLTLDLPLERTAERNAYRNSYINLERAIRDAQELEDSVKLDVRNGLRDLLESRESLRIQSLAVQVAQRRVDSNELLLELGRAEIRDVLEAQDALISAQNQLTAALVAYRIAELELQSDLGLLEVGPDGLWREYRPEEVDDVNGEDE